MHKNLGAILIAGLILTTIIGGCGVKKATAVGATDNGGVTSQQVTNAQSSADVATEKASLQKIDLKTQQGQAELDIGLDQKMQSLDSALDKLDKSMGSI